MLKNHPLIKLSKIKDSNAETHKPFCSRENADYIIDIYCDDDDDFDTDNKCYVE